MSTSHTIDGSEPRIPAVVRNERVLATAAVVSRLGGCVFLMTALAEADPSASRFHQLLALSAAALLESVLLILACRRVGRVRSSWAAADAVVNALLLVLGALLSRTPADPAAPMYNYVQIAAVVAGLAPLRLRWTVVLAAMVALADVWAELHVAGGYPLWNIIPNAVTLMFGPLVAWMVGSQIRRAAMDIDRNRRHSVTRAGELAAEWERARHSAAVRERVLATIERLTAEGAVADAAIRRQLESETGWLRTFVESVEHGRDPVSPVDLRAALYDIALVRGGSGRLRIALDVADGLPSVDPERIEAITGAVWEAVTNIIKHAAVRDATIRAFAAGDEVVVEIADAGRGFDRTNVARGTGLAGSIEQRMRDVGGAADVESAPGRGTVVRLSAPGGSR